MPQTRHYEMKDSGVEWIGRMPIGWKIVPAKFFMKVQAGYPFDSERFDNSQGIPLIRIRDITSGHTETFYNGDYPEEYVVHNNDLLVGMDGDFNVRWWQGSEAVLNQRCCRILARNGLLLRYFYFLLPFYLKQVNELAYSTTVKHLANGDIGNADICLPPEDEQTAIAAYLDEKCATIDAIIAEAKASIEEYKSWKASVIFETVTKGLNPNAEMKDSGVEWIGEIPRGWAVERLKAMFSFGKGLPITKEDLVEQGIPVISYGQIHAKFNTGVEVLPQLLRYVDAKWLVSNANSLVSEGDFIFADTSEDMEGCGNCVYVDTLNEGAQLFAGYHTIIFKLKRSKHKQFLAYLFKSDAWRTQLRSRVGGVKLFSISRRMLNLATVILPPQNEQTAIAAYLDSKCAAIDGIILEKEDLIREMENYRRSLIFEVVTGKRRVC